MSKLENRTFRGCRILFRNFQGREQQFNSKGDRNFCLMLDDPNLVKEMETEGWNIKYLKPREEGDEPQAYVQVAVNYDKGRPPRVVMISRGGTKRTDLGGAEIDILDFAEVKNWDLVLNPYEWEVNGNKGIKAYLKLAFVTLDEEELELMYANVGEDDGQTPTMSSTVNEEEMADV